MNWYEKSCFYVDSSAMEIAEKILSEQEFESRVGEAVNQAIMNGLSERKPIGLVDSVCGKQKDGKVIQGVDGLFRYDKPIFDFENGLKKASDMAIERILGDMKDQKQKQMTIDWINASIQKLEIFKKQVEDDEVVMIGGYFDDNFPVPVPEERTENNLSMSIDFFEK